MNEELKENEEVEVWIDFVCDDCGHIEAFSVEEIDSRDTVTCPKCGGEMR